LKKERSRKYWAIQAVRVTSQCAFFALFLYLLFITHFAGEDYIGRVEIFFHFDPLLAMSAFLAARAVFAAFAFAAITLALTFIFGRYVCGWVCPMGSVQQFFSFLFKKAKLLRPRKEQRGRLDWKYLIFFFIVVSALFTVNLSGLLDPLSFLYRSFTASILPAFSYATTALLGLLYTLHLSPLANSLAQFMENLTLNAHFAQGFFLGLLFLGIALLNISRERFWCRYICPLGAMLGLAARWNVPKLRIDPQKCIDCHLCNIHCETQASPYPQENWKSPECVYCYTCSAICPTAAIGFTVKAAPEKVSVIDTSRRRLILTSVLALFVAPLFRITPARKRALPKAIRPPGALSEEKFLEKCVKCGECMKACPTNALQPASTEAGPEGIWTPVIVPRVGYCEYYCSLCSQVCPTGAIKELTIPEKIRVKIGSAWVNKNRCLPYALGRPCIVCEEHCPTSPKAIKFIPAEVKLHDGRVKVEKAPFVDLDLCIGCGICETKCPVVDDPAIYVTSVGESRSERNQLLLQLLKE
jgi:MauM/NapG family ferredoxin protein